jgi:hypothetical protein
MGRRGQRLHVHQRLGLRHAHPPPELERRLLPGLLLPELRRVRLLHRRQLPIRL